MNNYGRPLDNTKELDVMEALRDMIFYSFSCVRIAKILKYDPIKNLADVECLNIPIFLGTGEPATDTQGRVLSGKPLFSRPVFRMKGFNQNIVAGDKCLLLVSDFPMNEHLVTMGKYETMETQMHDANNSIVLVGNITKEGSSDNLVSITSGTAKVVLNTDNTITIANDQTNLLTLMISALQLINDFVSTPASDGQPVMADGATKAKVSNTIAQFKKLLK